MAEPEKVETAEEEAQGWRRRILVTRNTRGYNFECVVEGQDKTEDQVVDASKRLVERLERDYPRVD